MNLYTKKYCFIAVLFFLFFYVPQKIVAQEQKQDKNFLVASFATSVIKQSFEQDSIDKSILLLQKKSLEAKENLDKRVLYIFMGSLQEQNSAYKDASLSYAKAAGISVTQAQINSFILKKEASNSEKVVYNLLKKTSSVLVLDAVRCSLNAGESATALNYLNSSIRNSKDSKIIAKIKFYELIAKLAAAENDSELDEIIVLLKAYSSMQSMQSQLCSILFTLWYVNSDQEAANKLKKNFPKSVEASIVKGQSYLMPTPFWFFVKRKGNALELVNNQENKSNPSNIKVASNKKVEESSKLNDSNEKPLRQQVGLFGKKSNAKNLVDRLKSKGFDAYIEEETRPSGNIYFIVIVNENEKNTMGMLLKTAGFDCYPVF